MVKCCATGVHGKSDEFYKIGRDWFKNKAAYVNYLKSKDITYQDVLSLLTEDKSQIISSSAKDKIIEIIMSDYKMLEVYGVKEFCPMKSGNYRFTS